MKDNQGCLIINLDTETLLDEEAEILNNKFIGGVLLFEHNFINLNQIKSLIADIKSIKSNLLIAIDHEGGRVQRFKKGFTSLPSFNSIGNIYEMDSNLGDKIAYYSGYIAGYELKEIGVDVNFSPVVDLSTNSNVLSSRTFSKSSIDVARLSLSYIQGLIDNGIIPTLKHYPGHGCVSGDTHTDLMSCKMSWEEIYKHLIVFEKIYNKQDVPIMTSHIQFNNISKDPVTTSYKWLNDIANKVFGKYPFFISDDLEMLGIKKHYPELSKLSVLEKTLEGGCSMAIVTTMQDKKIIEEKRSYLFYKNEYLEKLNSQYFHLRDINLPCLHELTYNKGDVDTYRKATEVVGRHIKE
tara:strand:- start:125 stop:1180 length:1056 start_codon:yes stop_codon:yes gene_type:complete